MKYIHLAPAALFGLFAYWQLNDPDWYVWVPAYLGVACFVAWHSFGRPPRWSAMLLLGLLAGWGILRLPDVFGWLNMGAPSIIGEMKAEQPYIELAREFLGILICLIVVSIYYYSYHRKGSTAG